MSKVKPPLEVRRQWIQDNRLQVHPYQTLQDMDLFNRSGIYVPKGSKYALSVLQTIDSPYDDIDPYFFDDEGGWVYLRKCPESDFSSSNQALRNCMKDNVPVGVFIQKSQSPNSRYLVLSGLVAAYNERTGTFTIQSI